MASLQANSKHISISVIGIGDDTFRLFTSYGVCVGMQKNNDAPIFTDEKFSATTNRHIRKFQFEHGGEIVNSGYFLGQLDANNIRVKTAR
jgi:hypothetical protein